MTDEQFKQLRTIQFAQLALLQSIEANMRQVAQQKKPAAEIGISLAGARALIERILKGPGAQRRANKQ